MAGYIGDIPVPQATQTRQSFTATASQTSFPTIGYTEGFFDCHLNGVKLLAGVDFNVGGGNGSDVILATGAALNDILEVTIFDTFTTSSATFTGTTTFADGGNIITATAGTDNVRLGENAGNSIASGGNLNVTIGKDAGTAITTGTDNTFVGSNAGDALIDSDHNVAIGHQALTADTKGSKSTAVGAFSLNVQNHSSATDSHNTAVGYAAGGAMTTGTGNTFLGALAGDDCVDGVSNVAIGHGALSADAANQNTAVGVAALEVNTASEATAIGYHAGKANTTGVNFTAVGKQALEDNTTGASNTAVGLVALADNTTGQSNTGMGVASLRYNTTGNYNSAFGHNALFNNTTAAENTAVGYAALYTATTGASNAAFGKDALFDLTTGDHNSGLGQNALTNVTTGSYNVGSARGGEAITTGDGNVCIGYQANTPAADTNYAICLGQQVTGVGSSNFTFGLGATDSNIAFGATSITAPSDIRLKEDIQDATAGLGFIKDLRPVTFRWKQEQDVPSDMNAHVSGSTKRVMNEYYNHGFIAQEVKAVIDSHSNIKDGFDMWTEDEADGRQRIGDASLMPIMVKAVQELSTALDAALARIKVLEG
jgi:hypothetical protein